MGGMQQNPSDEMYGMIPWGFLPSMDGGILSMDGRIYGGNATVPSISSMILPNGANVRDHWPAKSRSSGPGNGPLNHSKDALEVLAMELTPLDGLKGVGKVLLQLLDCLKKAMCKIYWVRLSVFYRSSLLHHNLTRLPLVG